MNNVRSLLDRNEDPSEDRETSSFVGGEKSGLAVQNPREREGLHRHATNSPLPEGSKRVVIFANGFLLNDVFRSFEEPKNRKFMKEIENGLAPKELQTGSGEVHITLEERRNETYEPPPVPVPLFTGNGRTLAGGTSATTAVDVSLQEIIVDQNRPITSLQIRFCNGKRHRQDFNENHTVQDLLNFVELSTGKPAVIAAGFPPRRVTAPPSQTLKDAGLLAESITQLPG